IGQNRIFEKRAVAPAILVAGGDQNGFAGPNLPDRLARIGQAGPSTPAGKVIFKIGVEDRRLAAGSQHVGHAQNDVSSTLGGIKNAVAVFEAARFIAKFVYLAI